ncbi:MAG: deoxyribonuclease IV [Chloroflexota bacterium]
MSSQLKLGAHMSTAGGYYKALDRGREIGCTAVQLFTKNANQWAGKPISPEDVKLFKGSLEQAGYTDSDLIAHDSYLINLATPDDALWAKSLAAFGHELDRCAMLGVPALVTHSGAHVGSGEEAGIARIAEGIDRVLSERPDQEVTVLLETTAGQGTCLGYTFEHLRDVIGGVSEENRRRVAVCWDTCHLFAAGIDFTEEYKYERMVESFDRIIGLDRLRAIHMNDSVKGLGSRVDRHANIGKGMIGLEPFRFIMNDPRLAALPKVLETPKEADMADDIINMDVLRSLIKD